jgi:DNA-binding NarL/FixJ family response regulator
MSYMNKTSMLDEMLNEMPHDVTSATFDFDKSEPGMTLQRLRHNLQKAINRQFTQWNFSLTEKEIASHLLNGLSLKEIAQLRRSTDKSVKQQAYLIYRKAGLGGRVELSAFLLGGLLQPDLAQDEAEP